jgi:rsbT co-antagonist protein RsbR
LVSRDAGNLDQVLAGRRSDVIGAWQVCAAGLLAQRSDLPKIGSLLRTEAAEVISELIRYLVVDEDEAERAGSDHRATLTALASRVSAAHAREGLSAGETLLFMLSFRDALLPFIVEAFASDGARLTAELRRVSGIVDRLSIEAAEAHTTARERLIERQSRAILDLSTPILQIWPQILLLPLVGVVDTRRSQQVMEDLLTSIARERALVAILDVTGVPIIDTRVALHLTKTVGAANMLGAQVILTGISPDAAQTLVKLDVDLRGMHTRGTLHNGLIEALRMLGQRVGQSVARSALA